MQHQKSNRYRQKDRCLYVKTIEDIAEHGGHIAGEQEDDNVDRELNGAPFFPLLFTSSFRVSVADVRLDSILLAPESYYCPMYDDVSCDVEYIGSDCHQSCKSYTNQLGTVDYQC